METEKHIYEYLGDGVYARALKGNVDGGVWLLANDHLNPTDKIYLEPAVLEALVRFVHRGAKK